MTRIWPAILGFLAAALVCLIALPVLTTMTEGNF